MKLKAKFTLIISIFIIILLGLIAFLAFSNYKKSIKETISQQQFLMVSQLADEIDSKLMTAQEHLIAVGEVTPKDILRSPEKAQAFLDNRPSLHLMFDNHLFLFTPSGKIFVESPYAPGRRGFDASFREYIINTFKTKQPYISDPYVSSQQHKHPAIMLTVPLFDGKGKITGILAGGIDLMRDNFLGRISTLKIGETGNLYLYNTDGTMIMHPDKTRILVNQPRGLNRLYDMARDGFEGTGETTTSYGLKAVSSFKRMKAKKWILAANYPSVEAYRPVRRAEQYFLVVTIAGIVAVFLIISFIIKYLIYPIELFTRHVEDLPQKIGDERFLNIKTKDEIGTLALTFNKMVTEIDKRSALERSEELYRTITEFATDFVFWRAPDNKLVYVSENCEKFCGYTEEEFYASPELIETMIHPDDLTIWADHLRDVHSKGMHEQLELRIVTKNGQVRWIAHNCLPVYDRKGTYRGRRGSHSDTTERKQAEEALKKAHDELEIRIEERTNALSIANAALRESEERLSLALKAAGQSIYDSDLKTGEAIVSPEYAVMLGYDPVDFHETTAKWIQRVHPDDKKLVADVYRAYIKGEIQEYKVEFRQKTKDGNWKWILSLGKISERDAAGNPLRMIGTHTDITERKQAEEQIRYLATHDALTNLPSLRLAKDRIFMALERAKRNRTLAAIMYIDLDSFKAVNDNYGHEAGDILLKEVGERLLSCVRKVDTVARIGGDEFLLVITELQSSGSAELIAKKAVQLLSQPIDLNGKQATVGASIGIALFPDHGDDAESLIKQADKAMYVIKYSGKNGYTFA